MTADAYLAIPLEYAHALGGLRWSDRGDAIVDADGKTLAVAEEVIQLLHGVFAGPAVTQFAYVLHLYRVIKQGDQVWVADGIDRLHRAFLAVRGAAGLPRNAGLLIAELCRFGPIAAGTPTWAEVKLALARLRRGGVIEDARAAEPPLPRHIFESRIYAVLRRWDDATLERWLRYGDGSAPDGERLAEPVESLPVRVARLLADAERRPRLAGAAVLVPVVDAALTLPPRRRSREAVPQGGYADVTTRGDPDRLLPSQFALDPDEFVRRFAERELLYYLREEPHAAEKPERVIILDQGVRTWGGVRLALISAALVLVKKDVRRAGQWRLVFSSSEGLVDAATFDPEDVVKLLEASDLTLHPADGVRRALANGGDRPRDLILLTHPRNVREPAVAEAAKGRRQVERLFALSVDERGRAELAEWAEEGPVPIRTFRVDLAAATAAQPDDWSLPAAIGPAPWSGDVEPVGFPFRPGIVVEPTQFAFSTDGDWLVAAGRAGILHGLTFDGSLPEVLPRAYRNGAVLTQVDAVLGVNGGVVVCGRMTPAVLSHKVAIHGGGVPFTDATFVVAHYDRASRRVRLHEIGPTATGEPRWATFPDMNCVAIRVVTNSNRHYAYAIDLDNPELIYGLYSAETGDRAQVAWTRMNSGEGRQDALPILTRTHAEPIGKNPYVVLDGNTIHIKRAEPRWSPFEPQRDGKPLLAGSTIERAELAGNVMVAAVVRGGERSLVLFRGPDGAVNAELPYAYRGAPFKLSADGTMLARRRGAWELVIAETSDPGRPKTVAAAARLHTGLEVFLAAGPFRLTIWIGGFEHTFRESGGRLLNSVGTRSASLKKETKKGSSVLPTDYDSSRFLPCNAADSPWRAVIDRLGQVVLFTAGGRLVASFLVRRERAAVWMPGGVFWGDPALIGGALTPNADRTIGQAIRETGGG